MKRAIVFAVRLSWFSHLVSQEMIIQSIICSSVNPVSMNTDNLTVAASLTGKKTVIQRHHEKGSCQISAAKISRACTF